MATTMSHVMPQPRQFLSQFNTQISQAQTPRQAILLHRDLGQSSRVLCRRRTVQRRQVSSPLLPVHQITMLQFPQCHKLRFRTMMKTPLFQRPSQHLSKHLLLLGIYVRIATRSNFLWHCSIDTSIPTQDPMLATVESTKPRNGTWNGTMTPMGKSAGISAPWQAALGIPTASSAAFHGDLIMRKDILSRMTIMRLCLC